MKTLVSALVLCLCAGCVTRSKAPEPVAIVPGTTVPPRKQPAVRKPETVKAYPVGPYTDPDFPDAMHERHTVYRREQSPDWNYLPDEPYALLLGPTVANSNPSPSYYVHADAELMNEQQRAYAEALREQNRAMKARLESLRRDAGKVPELEQEIQRLKKQIAESPEPPAEPEPATIEADDIFTTLETTTTP
jgi:hypothetical protein